MRYVDDNRCDVCTATAKYGNRAHRWCGKGCYDVLKARNRRRTHPNNHPERTPTYRGVIALDGEGMDGRYTLLATSQGQYIEDYDEGLSTRQCLDFLLKLPDKPLKWGFAFTYDVNMILRDLSRNELERLHDTSRVYFQDYSIQHFPGKLFRVQDRRTKRSVRIWDLYPFIQSSFVKFLSKFDLATPEEIFRISEMKDQRSDFSTVDPEVIRGYCMDECKYLEKGVSLFLQLFEDMGYRTNAYYSPGTIAALELRKQRVFDFYKEPPNHVAAFVDKAYYGGRAEISRVGPITGEFWQYDINSAYPYAATMLPCLEHGYWERTTTLHHHGVYHVKWNAPADITWGPFPWRPKSGSLKYPSAGVSYVWGVEILPWVDQFPIEILDGFVWRQQCDHMPFRYLWDLYQERTDLKREKDGREYVLKLILNSTYGKLAQRKQTIDGKKPRYQALAWAGLITATTRAMLATMLAYYQDHVIMVATDSILSDVPLPLNVNTDLGGWDAKRMSDLFVVGAGFLFAGQGAERVVRTRGMRSQDIRYAELENAWRLYGRDGTYAATFQRFFGYGMSLQRREGYRLWRRFWTITLEKRFTQFPRRQWVTGNRWDGRTCAPTLTDARGADLMDGMADLMRGDLTPLKDAQLAQLLLSLASRSQLDDATSQPDWVIESMAK